MSLKRKRRITKLYHFLKLPAALVLVFSFLIAGIGGLAIVRVRPGEYSCVRIPSTSTIMGVIRSDIL